jgi:nicotinamidase-related amidase
VDGDVLDALSGRGFDDGRAGACRSHPRRGQHQRRRRARRRAGTVRAMAAVADLDRLALVVVDVQEAFEDAAFWGPRNNPDCESNIVVLLDAWRAAGRPVVFVRHDSDEPASPLRPGQPGNEFKAIVAGEPDLLVAKRVNSSFHGTPDLDAWLHERDLDGIVVCGITTNHCCETTARVGGNLGHRVLFALDATHTFDRTGPDGTLVTADELARVTGTNLHDEFGEVVATRDLV